MKSNQISSESTSHSTTQLQKKLWYHSYLICSILLLLIFGSLPVMAQPSGGPYGPMQLKYDLPETSGRIYYAAPDGKAENPGQTLEQPTTLAAAIEKVETGDAIVLRGGTYRTGGLLLNQGITIQPYQDEHPVVKGTMVASQWEHPGDGLWKTSWTRLFASAPADWYRPRRSTPLYLFNNDMVFVDGKLLNTVGSRDDVNENSFYIDYDSKEVYIGTDPADKLVEITAFDSCLIRTTGECHGKTSDGKGPVIKGIVFTQYAFRAFEIEGTDPEGISPESKHGKDVTGMTMENCEITYCSRVAGYFRGDNFTMRNCLVSDTSTEGVFVLSSSDVLLEKNIFRRNNIENIEGYYPAAVKIFNQCYRATCRNNLVIEHPNSNGIWFDVGNVNGIFVNNWVMGTDNGFFFEISNGAICAGNVFVDCPTGVKVLNSCDVQVYQNTMVNSGVSFERTSRSAVGDHFGWHPSTGPDVEERDGHVFVNNLLYADEQFNRIPLQFRQQSNLYDRDERLQQPQVTKLDYNVYVRRGKTDQTLIAWSPTESNYHRENLTSPAELNKLQPKFSVHSRVFEDYSGPVFKSIILRNYELIKEFPGASTASPLPDEIASLLGKTYQGTNFPGAFPVLP